jgi:transposase
MIPSSVRILVCLEPQDMRRSFDRLALVVREHLGEDPQSGALYVFVGKRATRAKVLWWERNGYCLLCKRLHRSLFVMPESHPGDGLGVRIDATELGRLLTGVERKRGMSHSA